MFVEHVNKIKHDLKIILKGYKDISAVSGLANFCILAIAFLLLFILLNYEAASDWHTTSFVLQSTEFRYSRGGEVLDIYTTDGRKFVLNQNEKEICEQLREGVTYNAVYSDDLFHDTLRALSNDETEFLSLTDTENKFHKDRTIMLIGTIVSFGLAIFVNAIYAIFCIQEERRRMRKSKKFRTAKKL